MEEQQTFKDLQTTVIEPDEKSELDALGYLRGVYQGRIIAEHTRMKAAIACLPFEVPKLSVTMVNHRGLGDAIDAARSRHIAPQSARVIEHERERER